MPGGSAASGSSSAPPAGTITFSPTGTAMCNPSPCQSGLVYRAQNGNYQGADVIVSGNSVTPTTTSVQYGNINAVTTAGGSGQQSTIVTIGNQTYNVGGGGPTTLSGSIGGQQIGETRAGGTSMVNVGGTTVAVCGYSTCNVTASGQPKPQYARPQSDGFAIGRGNSDYDASISLRPGAAAASAVQGALSSISNVVVPQASADANVPGTPAKQTNTTINGVNYDWVKDTPEGRVYYNADGSAFWALKDGSTAQNGPTGSSGAPVYQAGSGSGTANGFGQSSDGASTSADASGHGQNGSGVSGSNSADGSGNIQNGGSASGSNSGDGSGNVWNGNGTGGPNSADGSGNVQNAGGVNGSNSADVPGNTQNGNGASGSNLGVSTADNSSGGQGSVNGIPAGNGAGASNLGDSASDPGLFQPLDGGDRKATVSTNADWNDSGRGVAMSGGASEADEVKNLKATVDYNTSKIQKQIDVDKAASGDTSVFPKPDPAAAKAASDFNKAQSQYERDYDAWRADQLLKGNPNVPKVSPRNPPKRGG
jgi:hypothetical protein